MSQSAPWRVYSGLYSHSKRFPDWAVFPCQTTSCNSRWLRGPAFLFFCALSRERISKRQRQEECAPLPPGKAVATTRCFIQTSLSVRLFLPSYPCSKSPRTHPGKCVNWTFSLSSGEGSSFLSRLINIHHRCPQGAEAWKQVCLHTVASAEHAMNTQEKWFAQKGSMWE